jgi:CHAT domain-containing protein
LARAFLIAGAKNILVALWKIPDESTSTLMQAFYENILQKNQSYALALRNSMITVKQNPLTSHERHWASFYLIGF